MIVQKKQKPTSVYKSEHIANFFIREAIDEKMNIDLLRLIKMCYFGYGWVLSIMDGKKLIEEDIHAWKFGPVIPSVYHAFKHWELRPITKFVPSMEISKDEKIQELKYRSVNEDTMEGRILSIVWNAYKHKSVNEVVSLTHQPGTPWAETYHPGERDIIIPTHKIKKHFDAIIQKRIEQLDRKKNNAEPEPREKSKTACG